MMRPSVQGVDPPVCCTPGCYCYICKRQLCGFPQCAASWMTYARDSFVNSQGGLLSSRGGGGPRHIGRHIGTSLTVPPFGTVWATHRLPCSVTSVVVRWYSVLRMTFCTRSIVSIKACVPCS